MAVTLRQMPSGNAGPHPMTMVPETCKTGAENASAVGEVRCLRG
jgi:hypothetical protein